MFPTKNILLSIALFISVSGSAQFGYSKQTMKRIFLLLIIPLLMLRVALAQDVELKLPASKKHLYVNRIPFDNIQILDNRINSTVFIFESKKFAYPTIVGVEAPLAGTVHDYLQNKTLNKKEKGNGTMLINIKQLRIPDYSSNARNLMLLSADVYFNSKNGYYRKLISLNTSYDYTQHSSHTVIRNIAATMSMILNELISISTFVYERNVLNDNISDYKNEKKTEQLMYNVVDYSRDTTQYTMQQINVNVKTLWKNYLIVTGKHIAAGVYESFDDFRNNKLSMPNYSPNITFNAADSAYIINSNSIQTASPYAVSDGKDLYINIFSDDYLKLKQEGNTFYFHIPKPLINEYALQVIKINAIQTNGYYKYGKSKRANSTGGGLDLSSVNLDNAAGKYLAYVFVAAIAVVVVTVGIHEVIKVIIKQNIKHKEQKLIKNKIQDKYRLCYIDMDTGDFIVSSQFSSSP